MFHPASPILRVNDLRASIEYYEKQLGFKTDWVAEEVIASVSRDTCHIILSERDQGNPGAWVWIGVADAEAVFNEYKEKKVKIRHAPANYWWAYEMQVEDIDGNVLRFGSDPKKDTPLGDWLDMYGNIWHIKEEEKENTEIK